MAIGIVPGRFDPEPGAKVHPLGDAFIKAIRVLIARSSVPWSTASRIRQIGGAGSVQRPQSPRA
jgi:hypothetical protein